MLYVVTFTSGDESTDPFGGSGEGYYDATLSANGSCGTLVTIPPTVSTTVANGIWFSEQESGQYMCCALQGNLSQEFFTEMSIQLSGEVFIDFFTTAANCIFSTTSLPGFSVWEFPAPVSFPFENGHNYPATFTTNNDPAAMNLFATATATNQIDLTWTDNTNSAIYYNLARDGDVIAQLANDVFSYDDTGLTPDTLYMYYITGVDSSNDAVYLSAYANATTESIPVPEPVLFLGALNGDQFFTANGDLNVGGNVFTYSAGTLTPCNTYTDITGETLNPNPITFNSDGYLTNEIWTIAGANVRVRIVDTSNNLLQDLDNIPGIPGYSSESDISVIDSIYSTDTSNAASANAVNWVYKVANASYSAANVLANTANTINTAQNTCSFYANGTLVLANSDLNFNNSATVNVSVTSNATINAANALNQTNVAFSVNIAGAINLTSSYANSSAFSQRVGSTLFQWGNFTCIDGTLTVHFSQPFSNAAQTSVTVTWAYTAPDAGYIQGGSVSQTSFNYTNGNSGECYYMAVGPA